MSARNWTVIALFVLLATGLGTATPPRQVYVQPQQYQNSAALLPAYGPSFSSSDDLLKQILEEVRGLRKDVQGLKGGTPGQQQDGALGVVGTRCLSCHQDGKAQDKGGGFVLVEKDSSLAELSLAEKRRVVRLVQKGDMPPSGKLPDAEVKLLTEFFDPAKQAEKEKQK